MAGGIKDNDYSYATYWDSNASYAGKLSENQYPLAGSGISKLFPLLTLAEATNGYFASSAATKNGLNSIVVM